MTLPAVVSRTAVPAAPHASASEPRENISTADHFDRQLHAARQQVAAKPVEHSTKEPDPRESAPKPRKPGQQPSDKSSNKSPVAGAQAASKSVPALPSTAAAKTADIDATVADVPADQDEPDSQVASDLAGAMLALLGPSAAGVLRPAAAGAARALAAGKAAASDAKAASPLPPGDAGAAVTAAVSAALAIVHAPIVADPDVLRPVAASKDPLEATAQTLTPLAPPAPAAPAALAHALQLPSSPGGQAFNHELGQQVAWLSGQDVKQARIRLHPEELGSLDVSVSVTHGRVDVVFSAQHPAAVTAVQQSLPQLDHMLAQHGLSLGHAEVGQQHRGDHHGHASDADTGALEEVGDIHGGAPMAWGNVGLLDAFA